MVTLYLKSNSVIKIVGLILVGLFLFSRIYDLPIYLSAILSFCWFLYVPYGVGSLILEILQRHIKKLNSCFDSIGIVSTVTNWFIGTLTISAIVYVLFTININIININIINFIGPLFLILSVGSFFVSNHSKLIVPLKKHRLRIALILIMGISFGLYVRSFSPFPLSPGIDVFNHMYVIESILDNSPSNSPLVYFPTFDIIIALASSTFGADLNSVFWMGSVFLSMVFSLSCYVMLYYFLKNNAQALLGTAIALPLTEMGFATNLQFFYPASFMMSIFPLMFFTVDYLWKKVVQNNKTITIVFTMAIFSVSVLIHTYIGFIVCLLLSLYVFCSYYLAKNDRLFFIYRLVTVVLALILLAYCLGYVSFQFKFDFIKSNLFESYHLYNTFTKLNILEQWYTKEVLLASAVGYLVLSFYKNKNIVILNSIGIVMLLTYFQQISDIHRLMPLERSFIGLGAITTFTLPVIILTQKFKISHLFYDNIKKIKSRGSDGGTIDINNKNQRPIIERFRSISLPKDLGIFRTYEKNSKLLNIYIVLVFMILFPVLMLPFDTYMDPYTKQGYDFTNYTFAELSAAAWIKENIPKNHKIYSDPSTVIEMRGLSNRPNIEGIGWNTTTAYEVRSVLLSENATYAYQSIISNHGNDITIVISPRTSEWLTGREFFIQAPIEDFNYFNGIEKFFDEQYFQVEYNENGIMILTLK